MNNKSFLDKFNEHIKNIFERFPLLESFGWVQYKDTDKFAPPISVCLAADEVFINGYMLEEYLDMVDPNRIWVEQAGIHICDIESCDIEQDDINFEQFGEGLVTVHRNGQITCTKDTV